MKRLFVISDLHLGGRQAEHGQPSFQMCSIAGQKLLGEFFLWAGQQHSAAQPVHLVLNGDIVDFLAEHENGKFISFTANDDAATRKLQRIFRDPALGACFDALAGFVHTGAQLTVLLGNHDLELSLPGPRREFLERLGSGCVEFIGDNQALPIGPVLIEHGNRYDSWNVIDHNKLRAVRSALSRREVPPEFSAPPGSELVVRIMNRIKNQYSFIDLLKPENEAALPLLAALAPEHRSNLSQIAMAAKLYLRQRINSLINQYITRNDGNIAAQINKSDESSYATLLRNLDAESSEDRELRSAEHGFGAPIFDGGESRRLASESLEQRLNLTDQMLDLISNSDDIQSGNISYTATLAGTVDIFRSILAKENNKHLDRLRAALINFAHDGSEFLNTERERKDYLNPAQLASDRGFKVIIYGHTHLLKNISFHNMAKYLNTGTWADIMFLPEVIFENDLTKAREALFLLAKAIVENQIDEYRRRLPGFAQVEIGEGDACASELYIFRGRELAPKHVGPGSIWRLL